MAVSHRLIARCQTTTEDSSITRLITDNNIKLDHLLQGVTHEELFHQTTSDWVREVIDGQSLTILVYGLPCSGKSYTVFGSPGETRTNPSARGIIVRCFEEFTNRLSQTNKAALIKGCLYHITNNGQISDLIDARKRNLQMKRVTPNSSTTSYAVIDASQHTLTSVQDVIKLVEKAILMRNATGVVRKMGDKKVIPPQSTSNPLKEYRPHGTHAVFQYTIETCTNADNYNVTSDKSVTSSTLTIIDLAGNDIQNFHNTTQCTDVGLNALHDMLIALGAQSPTAIESCLSSSLTQLLYSSLFGSSRCLLINTLSSLQDLNELIKKCLEICQNIRYTKTSIITPVMTFNISETTLGSKLTEINNYKKVILEELGKSIELVTELNITGHNSVSISEEEFSEIQLNSNCLEKIAAIFDIENQLILPRKDRKSQQKLKRPPLLPVPMTPPVTSSGSLVVQKPMLPQLKRMPSSPSPFPTPTSVSTTPISVGPTPTSVSTTPTSVGTTPISVGPTLGPTPISVGPTSTSVSTTPISAGPTLSPISTSVGPTLSPTPISVGPTLGLAPTPVSAQVSKDNTLSSEESSSSDSEIEDTPSLSNAPPPLKDIPHVLPTSPTRREILEALPKLATAKSNNVISPQKENTSNKQSLSYNNNGFNKIKPPTNTAKTLTPTMTTVSNSNSTVKTLTAHNTTVIPTNSTGTLPFNSTSTAPTDELLSTNGTYMLPATNSNTMSLNNHPNRVSVNKANMMPTSTVVPTHTSNLPTINTIPLNNHPNRVSINNFNIMPTSTVSFNNKVPTHSSNLPTINSTQVLPTSAKLLPINSSASASQHYTSSSSSSSSPPHLTSIHEVQRVKKKSKKRTRTRSLPPIITTNSPIKQHVNTKVFQQSSSSEDSSSTDDVFDPSFKPGKLSLNPQKMQPIRNITQQFQRPYSNTGVPPPHINTGSSRSYYEEEHGRSQIADTVSGHELHQSVLSGDKSSIIKKLVMKYGVDYRDQGGRTALMYSVLGNHPKITELLISMGAEVDAVDSSHLTALFWAVYQARSEVMKVLLKNGANIFINDPQGRTVFHWVMRTPNVACIKVLCKYASGDIQNKTDSEGLSPLHWAVMCEQSQHITTLLSSLPSTNICAQDSKGRTPLNYAALIYSPICIKAILDCRPNAATFKDDDGRTALHFTCAEGSVDCVRALLACKSCDLHSVDKLGTTPLHWAAATNQTGIVQLLLRRGADRGQRDHKDMTPLDHARQRNHDECIKLLESYGLTRQESSWSIASQFSIHPPTPPELDEHGHVPMKRPSSRPPSGVTITNNTVTGSMRQETGTATRNSSANSSSILDRLPADGHSNNEEVIEQQPAAEGENGGSQTSPNKNRTSTENDDKERLQQEDRSNSFQRIQPNTPALTVHQLNWKRRMKRWLFPCISDTSILPVTDD